MFAARLRLRAFVPLPQNGCACTTLQRRNATSLVSNMLQAENEVAKKLKDTQVWRARGSSRKGPKTAKGDKYRVNIVSEELCDDVVNYIKPTLDRHKGCDIVDLFPGAGVWSRKMNDYLKPRSHILLEPDEDLYRPFLKPILDRPGVKLLPESGIIWEDLNRVLCPETLPHQVERRYGATDTPEHNDTLLVLANFSLFPKKKFRTFDSLAQLLLYQFITSIRAGALFHKYGLVRMLVWTSDMDKFGVLPRTVQRRRRLAFETEINTESITEVAGADTANVDNEKESAGGFFRDSSIDMESMALAYKRMQDLGISPVEGRESKMLREYLDLVASGEDDNLAVAGEQAAFMHRPYQQLLAELQEKMDKGQLEPDSAEMKRYKSAMYKSRWSDKRQKASVELLKEMREVEELYKHAHSLKSKTRALKKAEKADAEWNQKVDKLEKSLANEFLLSRDNLHVFRQDPPVLGWDRRYVDPLVVREDEFFPMVPCALLDIQPRAVESILRETGPGSSRAGDIFDVLLRALMQHTTAPMSKALEGVFPGAADGVLPSCPSITDPAKGGRHTKGYGELTARTLNVRQLVEIAEAWKKWPFQPEWPELVARTTVEETTENLYETESLSTSRWDF